MGVFGAVQPLVVALASELNPVYISTKVVGCSCHACQNHHRAYIHHLLVAHEMLADVLLHVHNTVRVLWGVVPHMGEIMRADEAE